MDKAIRRQWPLDSAFEYKIQKHVELHISPQLAVFSRFTFIFPLFSAVNSDLVPWHSGVNCINLQFIRFMIFRVRDWITTKVCCCWLMQRCHLSIYVELWIQKDVFYSIATFFRHLTNGVALLSCIVEHSVHTNSFWRNTLHYTCSQTYDLNNSAISLITENI